MFKVSVTWKDNICFGKDLSYSNRRGDAFIGVYSDHDHMKTGIQDFCDNLDKSQIIPKEYRDNGFLLTALDSMESTVEGFEVYGMQAYYPEDRDLCTHITFYCRECEINRTYVF